MSLYNIVFGIQPTASLVLAMLGLRTNEVPRLRDAWIEKDALVILTRAGGGSREGHEILIASLQTHPAYIKEENDEFDRTYARFYFKRPEKYDPKRLDHLMSHQHPNPGNMRERMSTLNPKGL